MTQVHCKWIVENPRWLLGPRWGSVVHLVCVRVQTCYRVQRSVEKGMVQDCEKLGSACEKKNKRKKEKQPRADKVEFVDTKKTT